MIVDDDEGIREALRLALELEGFEVRTAANGKEALEEMSQAARPGLIVLDLMMPVMDGWAFAEELGKEQELAKIPIIVLTAYGDRADSFTRSKAILKKPVSVNALIDMASRFCISAEGQSPVTHPPPRSG